MAKKRLRKGIKALIIVGSVVTGLLSIVGGVYLTLQIMKDSRRNTDPEHVDPEKVILTTFTVKAANEFKEKAKAELYKIGIFFFITSIL